MGGGTARTVLSMFGGPAKMAEPIKMPFGIWTRVSPAQGSICISWDAHWRNLANTIEPSMCSGDAAFLSIYFDHLLYYLVLYVSCVNLCVMYVCVLCLNVLLWHNKNMICYCNSVSLSHCGLWRNDVT